MDERRRPCSKVATPLGLGRLLVPDHVVRRRFGSETVILNLKTGNYHGVNTTGGRILDAIQETNDADEAARRVADEFEAPISLVSGDVQRLCAALLERGLIVVDDG